MSAKSVTVLAVVAAGVVTFFVVMDGKKQKCKPVELSCTQASVTGAYVDIVFQAIDCPGFGYLTPDGGQLSDMMLECAANECSPPKCPAEPRKKEFACAMRPAGVAKELCGKKNPDGGLPIDFGDENVMRPGQFDGSGCKRCPCVQIAGIPWKG